MIHQKMNRNIIHTFLICLTLSNLLNSQTLDEETGFIYVKAEYLLETGRYDEAVTNYNQVITKSPGYKNALIHRGKAKYALGAYKGAKNDAVQSIEIKGILPENASLLGRAFATMGEMEAAINSYSAAIHLDANNGEYLFWRAQAYESLGQRLKSCADYENASIAGNPEALVKAKNYCGISISNNSGLSQTNTTTVPNTQNTGTTTEPPTTVATEVKNDSLVSYNNQNDAVTSTVPVSDSSNVTNSTVPVIAHIDDSEPPVIDETIPKNDDTVNAFVVDEDLSIQISGQELGLRKIKEVPSILILSDENGKVCINICVNKEGQVVKAEFNSTLSTIVQKSLVSLALRKAKEFEFEPGKYDSQCGIMIFDVKGS